MSNLVGTVQFFPRAEKNDKFYKPTLILIKYFIMTVSTSARFISQVISAFTKPDVF